MSVVQFRVAPHGAAQRIEALLPGRSVPIGQVELRRNGLGQSELVNLRVAPDFRRRHIGSQLVQRTLDIARAQNLGPVTLEARPGDAATSAHGLVSMYQKLGFRSHGMSPNRGALMTFGAPPPIYAPVVQGRMRGVVQRMEALAPLAPVRSADQIYVLISNEIEVHNHTAANAGTKLASIGIIKDLILELKALGFDKYEPFKKLWSACAAQPPPKRLAWTASVTRPAYANAPPPFDVAAAKIFYTKYQVVLQPIVDAGAEILDILTLCHNLLNYDPLHADATIQVVMQDLGSMAKFWGMVKPPSMKRLGEELSKPKKWNEFKGVLGEIRSLAILAMPGEAELKHGKRIRVGKDKKMSTGVGLAEQDVDISYRDSSDRRHYLEVKYDPETLVNKIVEPVEIQGLDIPMYITSFDSKAVTTGSFTGLPKQPVAYDLVRKYHSEEKDWKGKDKPAAHYVTWMVPNMTKWMLIFVTTAAEKLASLGQFLRLGPYVLGPALLMHVRDKVRHRLNGLSKDARNDVIKDPGEILANYLN